MKREAKFGTVFRHWLKARPGYSAAYELKQTRTNSLAFSAVQEHQLLGLKAAKGEGILYKAPDDSAGHKPFDFFYLRHAYAYVVIKYPKCFVLIDVETFIYEKTISGRKSLTSQRARELGTTCVDL